jgi:hypothetical protein
MNQSPLKIKKLLKHFKFGRPPAIASAARLWLVARQTWNVSRKNFKKIK